MLFEFSKLVGVFINPANWILLCILACWFQSSNKAKWSCAFALIIFLVFSNTMLYERTLMCWTSTVKGQMPLTTTYQSALIFGGGVGQGAQSGQVDLYKSGDRILEGIRLYRLGMVKRLYFSGEPIFAQQPVSQAQFTFEKYLIQMGVDIDDVTIDPYARNTAENLVRFDEMLRPEDRANPILAISSGCHLPRIMKGLEAYKLKITPYAVDMPSKTRITNWKELWPSWNTVLLWQQLIKEWVGYGFIGMQIQAGRGN